MLGVAGVDREPTQPRLELLGVTEAGEFMPGGDERLLGSVGRQVGVTEDAERDRHQAVAHGGCQRGERSMVTARRQLHQGHVHADASRPSGPSSVCLGHIMESRRRSKVRTSSSGPHPGTVEASIGKEATEELAVARQPGDDDG